MRLVIFQPGQRLCGERGGHFLVLDWAGEGSYARVYRARADGRRETGDGSKDVPEAHRRTRPTTDWHLPSTVSGTAVAVKLAKAEVDGAADRLRREQEAYAHLLHPAIPALVDAGCIPAAPEVPEGLPWIVLDWVEGDTLRRRLDRNRGLPLVQAVPILLRVADAVAAVHAAGWVHGDLRPDNILIEAGTRHAFLLDLGAASPVGGTRRPGTREAGGSVAGKDTTHDLRRLAELLAWSLTGVDPALDPERLSLAAGYHPAAVRLWHEARDGRLPAAAFRHALQRLERQLAIR